jgi:magnesium transporter
LTSVPVVDEAERLIGVITIDDIVSVVEEEASEDLLLLGGVGNDDLAEGAVRTALSRFRWLFVNLFTAFLAAGVVRLFEGTLEQVVALAVLMPIVAGMGGNAGTQTLTVAVRALATKELSAANYWRVTLKEVFVGMMNGIAFAFLVGVIAWMWFDSPVLGGHGDQSFHGRIDGNRHPDHAQPFQHRSGGGLGRVSDHRHRHGGVLFLSGACDGVSCVRY